jgi:hypothetical protein
LIDSKKKQNTKINHRFINKKKTSRTLFSSIAPIKAKSAFLSIDGRGDGAYERLYFLKISYLNKHTSHRISVLNPSPELI